MIEPAEHDADTPTMRLAGKDWPVPELGVRQLRKARRKIFDLTDVLIIKAPKNEKGEAELGDAYVSLTEEQYGDLCDVIYWGLTRAHAKLSREEFDEWPCKDSELMLGFFV